LNGKSRRELRRVFANPHTRHTLLFRPPKRDPKWKAMRGLRRVHVTNLVIDFNRDRVEVAGAVAGIRSGAGWSESYRSICLTPEDFALTGKPDISALFAALTGYDTVTERDGVYSHTFTPYFPSEFE